MTENVISEQIAQEQIDVLLDFYDIDFADIEKKEAREAVESSCKRLKRAVRKGMIDIKTVDDTIEVIQNLSRPFKNFEGPIVYKEITGRAKVAMRDNADTDHFGRIYALLGGMAGEGEAVIQKLRGKDMSVAECLGVLFLQV